MYTNMPYANTKIRLQKFAINFSRLINNYENNIEKQKPKF